MSLKHSYSILFGDTNKCHFFLILYCQVSKCFKIRRYSLDEAIRKKVHEHCSEVAILITRLYNKKTFLSNANRPLADRCPEYIVNKFEHVSWGILYGEAQVKQV